MNHICDIYDDAVQFVCDCGARFVLKSYESRQCPKCDNEWFYDIDWGRVTNARTPRDQIQGANLKKEIRKN